MLQKRRGISNFSKSSNNYLEIFLKYLYVKFLILLVESLWRCYQTLIFQKVFLLNRCMEVLGRTNHVHQSMFFDQGAILL